jgi:tetratricopeptide (TPR) repeat protein
MGLAGWELGEFDEATEAYQKALAVDPADADSLYDLTLLGRSDLASPDALRAALDNPALDWRQRARLHFALGKQAESAEQYDRAFEHFTQGNRIRRAQTDFGIARKLGNASAFLELFEESDGLQGSGCSSRRPIFVTGMPRSGTTLLAQILNAHPDIESLGERLDLQKVVGEWARRAGGGADMLNSLDQMEPDVWSRMGEDYLARLPEPGSAIRHLVDKMPFNVNLVGFMRLMLPEATVIICRRDLLDVAVSCFGTGFSETTFSYDLFELGQFVGMCDAVARFWEQRWPGHVHVVDYETLVTEPDAVVRALFDRIGVEWDESWRSFHALKTAVRTASISQVRQPLYATSVGRWRHYESHLEPLRAGIADARHRLGNKSQAPG